MATKKQKLQIINYLKAEAHNLRDLKIDVSADKLIQELHDSMIAVANELERADDER